MDTLLFEEPDIDTLMSPIFEDLIKGCVQVKFPASVVLEYAKDSSHGNIAASRGQSRMARNIADHGSVGGPLGPSKYCSSDEAAIKVGIRVARSIAF